MIIGVSGKRGTGKDTLSLFMKELGWTHESFARALKRKVREDFDMTEEQTDGSLKETIDPRWMRTPRELMIDVGQFYRKYDPLFWVRKTFKNIQSDPQKNYVISDVRFQNEANFIRANGGIVVRLNRPIELNIYKGIITDISEVDLDSYADFKVVLDESSNRTLDDLKAFAAQLQSAALNCGTDFRV